MAGQSDVTTVTKDSLNEPLENSFDANKVGSKVQADLEITRAFDQERRKIKTELNKDEQELRDVAKEQEALGNFTARNELLEQADKVQQKALLFDGISSALYGPNANGATGYVAKAVSPQVANQIGQVFKDNAANNTNLAGEGSPEHLLAHALLGAAVSAATGNDALTGGLGASTGEGTVILLSKYIYKVDKPSELTAEQKDTISNITTLAGVAIGSTTGEITDAVNAGETAKVAVEDNSMGGDRIGMHYKTNAELYKETWEMNNGPIGKFINKNQKYILIGTDFLPVFGDIKGFSEAKSALDYVFASAAIVPFLGDGAKLAYKEAKASGSLEDVMKAKDLVEKDIKKSGKATEISGSQLIEKIESGVNVKPAMVKQGETGTYGELAPRSVKDGLTPDHIPSFAAVKKAMLQADIRLSDAQIKALRKNTNCVVVKTCDHQSFSRTYGGRNTNKIDIDSKDLYKAAELDLDTWEPIWRKQGWSESKIRSTRAEIHQLNKKLFKDMGINYGPK